MQINFADVEVRRSYRTSFTFDETSQSAYLDAEEDSVT